jgi:hypothetical protein
MEKPTNVRLRHPTNANKKFREIKEGENTMVYFPAPIGTTSLRGLALAPLVWPRNGVGLRTVLELAVAAISIAAIIPSFFQLCYSFESGVRREFENC